MTVRDLFYNTPARQKFMKSDRAEGAACVNAALRCALGHPEVCMRMLREGEEIFFSPGDGRSESAVYALLGRDIAKDLLACEGEGEGVSVSGFVSAPHAGRGSRAMQFFFVNGRAFRSATMLSALEQAYKNTLLTGRFPACVLYLTLGCGKVDVNVHPTKSEVRFSEEKKVFDAVYFAVRAALSEQTARNTAEIRLSPTTQRVAAPQPKPDFYKRMTSEEFRGSPRGKKESPPAQTRIDLSPRPSAQGVLRDSGERYEIAAPVPAPQPAPRTQQPEPTETPEPAPAPAPAETPPYRVIGEALDTYILVETADALLLIDKHACHERILFDALAAGLGAQMSQTLLTPVTWSPGAEDAELLEQNAALLAEAGFDLERFGDDGVILRAVPADAEGSELALLEELTAALRTGRPEDRRETLCHTIACKAAIKAGSRSDPAELEALAKRVVSGEVRYCPHGRPVCVKLTKTELDKQFKRIV